MGTAGPYPYPETTDPIAQGADAIKNLATAVNARLPARIQAGLVTVPVTTSGAAVTQRITFPVAFVGTPVVLATNRNQGNPQNVAVATLNETSTYFDVAVTRIAGTFTNIFVAWLATEE